MFYLFVMIFNACALCSLCMCVCCQDVGELFTAWSSGVGLKQLTVGSLRPGFLSGLYIPDQPENLETWIWENTNYVIVSESIVIIC